MYICIYICVYFLYIFIYIYIYVYLCLLNLFMFIFNYICLQLFFHFYLFMCLEYVFIFIFIYLFLCIFIYICLNIFICICLFIQYDVITCNNPIFQHIHMCFLIYWSAISASLHTFVGGASGPGSRLRTRAEAKVWAQQLGSLERNAAGRWGRVWPMGAILAGKNVMKYQGKR
jgi:hypothetical protein